MPILLKLAQKTITPKGKKNYEKTPAWNRLAGGIGSVVDS